MPGPLMHQYIMRQVSKKLKPKLRILPLTPIHNCIPDIVDHGHGYDYHSTPARGTIYWRIDNELINIEYAKTRIARNRAVRNLVHYTADAFSVGQLANRFWGKKDNMIDLETDLLFPKKHFEVYSNEPLIKLSAAFFKKWEPAVWSGRIFKKHNIKKYAAEMAGTAIYCSVRAIKNAIF